MGVHYIRENVDATVRESEPLELPRVSHPSRGDWTNLGVEVYRETFGEDTYRKYSRSQFPVPMPARSLFGRMGLYVRLWSLRKAFFGVALATARRGTHARGVGARGRAEIVERGDFPEHDFFTPGRTFDCRLRHANATLGDDAALVARGCALKFADSDAASPFDLAMNTGPIPGFWNLQTFSAYGVARFLSMLTGTWSFQKRLMRRYPAALIGTIESQRSAPSSYADLVYYSKTPLPFLARDGRRRYAKYRILASGLEQESGLLAQDLQRRIWIHERPPGHDAPNDYLRQEYKDRLGRENVEYALQIQLREWDAERDTHEFFNPCRYWDEAAYPWLDLARVRMEEALPDAVTERTRVSLTNHPPSLGVTDADSAKDYRSLVWARTKVYSWSQAGRSLGRRSRGA